MVRGSRSRFGLAWPKAMLLWHPYTNMPEDVAKMAAETAEAIATGKLLPFGGKITKQDGTVVENVDDGMILGMNWYVKGVDDKLPQ